MQAGILKQVLFFILMSIGLLATTGFAAAPSPPLSADKAFLFSVTVDKPNQVSVHWQIAPSYYLYTKRMHFTFDPATTPDIRIPQGNLKYDPNLGQLEVISGNVNVPILLNTQAQKIKLTVDYQGCSENGFCYPPMQKTQILNLTTGTVSSATIARPSATNFSLQSLLTDQNEVRAILGAQHFAVLLLIFAGIGLLLAFTPCVLPMIPILTGIIIGQKETVTTKKAFLLSLIYVLGAAITYSLAGLAAAAMGSSLQAWLQKPWIIASICGLFVLLAFSLFNVYNLQMPRRIQNFITTWSNRQQGGTYVGVFLMGMISTLVVSPCVTAPLVGVLMYIAQTGDQVLGASALFAMGIGMGIPLVLIGMSAGKWLPKSGAWMEAVKKMFGFLMLGMAIWLSSRFISQPIVILFSGVLLLALAVFLGIYLPRLITRNRFARGLGFIIGVSGVFVVFGSTNMSHVMSGWVHAKTITQPAHSFVVIRDLNAFKQQLMLAQAAHKPVLLDFYADWCTSCVTMDKKVFHAPDVQRLLSNYILLRIDLTANTDTDQALLKYFDVIAPPTVLFFDGKGAEMFSQRIIGEVDAQEFITRINTFGNEIALKK